jgi:regulator of RNase E activity RraA
MSLCNSFGSAGFLLRKKQIPAGFSVAALLLGLAGAGISQSCAAADATPAPDSLITSPQRVKQYTPGWTGERMTDGRPKVSDDLIRRMRYVTITQAWGSSPNGYVGPSGWLIMHPDEVICGRVLTAQYLPDRADYSRVINSLGKAEGRIGQYNSWPIDMLQKGDVYVADGFGKVVDGTLAGDMLSTAIFARSGNGVIFDGGIRKWEGEQEIKGFNAWVRGTHPSAISGMMLMGINIPIHIGNAVVFPGDVVLAKNEGMVFVPADAVERVVTSAEVQRTRDTFIHLRLMEGKYTPGQADSTWTAEINADFSGWLKANRTTLVDSIHVPLETLDRIAADPAAAGGQGAGGGGNRGARGGPGGRGAGGGPATP